MKGYRFITDDDTARFCNRVTEALSNGWKLYGEPKMTFDKIINYENLNDELNKIFNFLNLTLKRLEKKSIYDAFKKTLPFTGYSIK